MSAKCWLRRRATKSSLRKPRDCHPFGETRITQFVSASQRVQSSISTASVTGTSALGQDGHSRFTRDAASSRAYEKAWGHEPVFTRVGDCRRPYDMMKTSGVMMG